MQPDNSPKPPLSSADEITALNGIRPYENYNHCWSHGSHGFDGWLWQEVTGQRHEICTATGRGYVLFTCDTANMTAWQQGDKAAAVSNFLAADWSARPLFAAGSPLNLSEDQFKALSDAERQAKSSDMMSQIASLKQLAQVVVQAGRDAAAKGDTAQARKCFTTLKLANAARRWRVLGCMQLVQLVGKAFVKMSVC